jgi:hypothetical protein
MANPDVPNGLKPVVGDGRMPRINTYKVAAGYALAIGQHGPLIMNAGFVERLGAFPTTKTILGVAVAPVAATGVEREIQVYDDPEQEYEAQLDDNTQTTRAAIVGKSFTLTGLALINAVTDFSQVEVDGTGPGAGTDTLVFHALRVSERIDNDVSLANTRIIGKFNPGSHIMSNEDPAST